MTQQKVNTVIDALVTVFDAAAALDGVVVVKGHRATLPAGDMEYLFIASDGGVVLGNEDIATSEIEWPGPGPASRNETGEVRCAVWARTGDQDDIDGRITRAYTLTGACEDILRADSTLGTTTALSANITDTRLRTIQDPLGFAAVVVFTVGFRFSA